MWRRNTPYMTTVLTSTFVQHHVLKSQAHHYSAAILVFGIVMVWSSRPWNHKITALVLFFGNRYNRCSLCRVKFHLRDEWESFLSHLVTLPCLFRHLLSFKNTLLEKLLASDVDKMNNERIKFIIWSIFLSTSPGS